MLRKSTFTLLLLLLNFGLYSQTVSSVIIDSKTNEPIPFATITTSEFNGVMSNEEGRFSITIDKTEKKQFLTIMCLGYEKLELPLDQKVPNPILLNENVFQTIPVFLETNKMSAEEIIEKAKEKLTVNYDIGYQKVQIFNRNSGSGMMHKFKVNVEESTFENINQSVMDEMFGSLNKEFVYLNETLSKSVVKGYDEGHSAPIRTMFIQSKEELASVEKLQNTALQLLEENFKSDSQLILKTGIIRLDKTETLDSILRQIKSDMKQQSDTVKKVDKVKKKNIVTDDFFLKEDSKVDFLHKSYRYKFTKEGYTRVGDDWVYIINFEPKGRARYKGKLYINAEDFGVVKATYKSARDVHKKVFNMFGVTANELSEEGVYLFKKNEGKYFLTYINKYFSSEAGIERPFAVIEKNANVDGKKRINKLKVRFDMLETNYNKIEIVYSNYQPVSKETFENFKPTDDYFKKTLNAYDPSFWNGYNILTPEKAIEDLKIE